MRMTPPTDVARCSLSIPDDHAHEYRPPWGGFRPMFKLVNGGIS